MKKTYKIAIVDYQMSNMFSVRNALDTLGFKSEVTSSHSKIMSSDGVILPGVGSFPEAMKNIRNFDLEDTINNFIVTGKPFMGICLGFQLLFDKSDEINNTIGMGVLHGEVKRFSQKKEKVRVPHVGWNSVNKVQKSNNVQSFDPLKKSDSGDFFYFVHSCYVQPDNSKDVYTTTEYGDTKYCSSILKENIFACQFHPEKSGEKGISIFSEFFN